VKNTILKSPVTGNPMSHVILEDGLDAWHCVDSGEWKALRARNFHDELHLIFTAPWQKRVIDERTKAAYEARVASILREDLYGRLQALHAELGNHPDRGMALAYLLND